MEIEIKYLKRPDIKGFHGNSQRGNLVALAYNYLTPNLKTDYRLAYYEFSYQFSHFYSGNLKDWIPVNPTDIDSISEFHEEVKEKFLNSGATIKII